MRRFLTRSMLLLILLGITLLAVPGVVQASPAQKVNFKPTAEVVTGITVQSYPGPIAGGSKGYDNDNATWAQFNYVDASGSFELKTFTTPYPLSYNAYLTSATWTVNGLNAYAIQGSQTAAYLARTFTATGTLYWGIRVWKRASGGAETEITAGTPVALVNRAAAGSGYQSTTWAAATKTSLTTTDALVVRVYGGPSGGPYTLLETFISFQLDATLLDNSTWTVYYWTKFTAGTPNTGEYRFGDTTHNSRILNLIYHKWPTINSVDLKIRYETTISSKDDTYRIVYQVDPSPTVVVLKAWTRDATALATYVFSAPTFYETNDGTWDWTDIKNIRVRFETLKSGGADTGGVIKEYEVWVTVTSPDAALFVDPASTVGIGVGSTFTIAIKATNFYNLYGWEFHLGFDKTILHVLRGPTPPTYALNYYVWYNVTETTTDIGYSLIAFTATEKHAENIAANGAYDVNEYIYRDLNTTVYPNNVDPGDLRLTAVPGYAAGSTVALGDTDVGTAIIAFVANEKHRENVSANGIYNVGEYIYKDTDTNGLVTDGDVRLTATEGGAAGSTVTAVNFVWLGEQVPLGTPATSAPSGGGTLTTITFIVVGIGSTTLDLYDTKMGDGAALPIPHVVTDGSFSNIVVPEFPLGAAVEIAIPVVLVFFWWTRKRKTIKPKIVSAKLPT